MRWFLIAALLCCCHAAHATPTLTNYSECGFFTSGTTQTCTFTAPQNPDVAFISQWSGGSGSNISSITGCGVNWLRVYFGNFNGSSQDVYLATDLTPGGSCNVTLTFTGGGAVGALVAQGEYVGVASMPLAYYPMGDDASINIPSQIGGATYPFITYEPNDVLVMIGESFNSCHGSFSSTGGTSMTAHGLIVGPDGGCINNLGVIQALDATLSTVGSYSTTVVNSQGSNSFLYPFVIRAQMPSGPAVVQRIPCSTTSGVISSLPCTPLTPPNTGDQWVLVTESLNGDATVADNEGTCKGLPSLWGNATRGLGYLCKNTNTTLPTFTLSSVSNLQNTDMVVEEVQGIDTTFPLYSGHAWTDIFHTNVGPNVNTFDVGPLSVPGGQCFLLVSFVGNPGNTAATSTTGFNLRGSWPLHYASQIQYTYDQQVCPAGLTTGYDNIITYASPHGDLEGGTWAFGATQNTSFPLAVQTLGTQASASSPTQTFFGPAVAGDTMTVCAIGGSVSNLVISSSPATTWHVAAGANPSDVYAAWYSVVPSTGTFSYTIGATWGAGAFANTAAIDSRFITAFDSANSNFTNSATTLSTGNISTFANHDWLVSCAPSVGSATGSYALPTNDLWSLNQYTPTDNAYIDSWSMVAGAAGSYSNTFTYNVSQQSAAIIFGFTTSIPPPPNVEPNVTVITMNGHNVLAYTIGAQ